MNTRRLILPILTWVALTCPLLAAEPKAIVKPVSQVEPGDITYLDGSDSTGDSFRWVAIGSKSAIPSESGKGAYFASGKPGKYEFLFIVAGVVEGKAKIDAVPVSVVVVAPPPAPGPAPTPKPDPTPTPEPPAPQPQPKPVVVGHLYVTYLADAGKLLPSHAAMKLAPAVREAFKTLDSSWRWYQSDEAEPKSLRLLDHVKDFPTVVIQDSTGKVIDTLAAPSEADVIRRIKDLRGSK